jgi:hypothetical protein
LKALFLQKLSRPERLARLRRCSRRKKSKKTRQQNETSAPDRIPTRKEKENVEMAGGMGYNCVLGVAQDQCCVPGLNGL